MLSLLLTVPSCIYSFWHGVIPTSYFIFNDFYICIIRVPRALCVHMLPLSVGHEMLFRASLALLDVCSGLHVYIHVHGNT